MTCGGSIVAIKRTSKQHYTRVAYRCAFHHTRGHTVCTNSVGVRQDILGSAILHAISDMLDEQVLQASVAKALERVRNEPKQFPDQRVAIEREFSLIQTRLYYLVEHIANGRATDAIDASLHHEEARKKTLLAELLKLDELVELVQVDENRLAKELRSRAGDIPALFARQIPLARQMLRKLLDGHFACEPVEKGGKRGYRFTATGTFDRLLTGVEVINQSGGGQGS